MSLIIATGTNLGNKVENLHKARLELGKIFTLIFASKIYQSDAVDFPDQPPFYNQVLEFERPSISLDKMMSLLLELEMKFGRVRNIPKGPRIIDLDIIFVGLEKYNSSIVTIPHPRLFERSFIVTPLRELPYFTILNKHFNFTDKFDNSCTPIN